MSDSLRKLFHANKTHQEESGSVKVLISLDQAASEDCLKNLRSLGLEVTSVTGNKLTGEIAPESISKLEQRPEVLEVERSVILKQTGDGGARPDEDGDGGEDGEEEE